MARTAVVTVPTGTLPDTIKTAFSFIYGQESQMAALKAKYISPKADEVTAAWRGLKKDTGIERKDLKLFYDIYKRQRLAEDLADEIDRDRILDNLRMAFNALQQGEMLSFIDAMEAANVGLAEAEADDDQGEGADGGSGEGEGSDQDGATGYGGWDEPGEPAALDGGAEGEAPADDADSIDGPVADAGEVAVHDPANDDTFAGGGTFYHEGAQAALDGVVREDSPYAAGTPQDALWRQGYEDTLGPVADAPDEDVAAAFGDEPAEEAAAEQQEEAPWDVPVEAPETEAQPVAEQQEYPAFADPTPDAMTCLPVYGADGEIVDTATSPEAWRVRALEIIPTIDTHDGLDAFAKDNRERVGSLMAPIKWQMLIDPVIDAIADQRKALGPRESVMAG